MNKAHLRLMPGSASLKDLIKVLIPTNKDLPFQVLNECKQDRMKPPRIVVAISYENSRVDDLCQWIVKNQLDHGCFISLSQSESLSNDLLRSAYKQA